MARAGLPLPLADGLDGTAKDLSQEGRMLQRDSDHATGELGRKEAQYRQAEVDKIDLQQQRRVAHQLDVDVRRDGNEPAPRHPRRHQQETERKRQRNGRHRDAERDEEAGDELRQKVREKDGGLREIVHCPRCSPGSAAPSLAPTRRARRRLSSRATGFVGASARLRRRPYHLPDCETRAWRGSTPNHFL